MAAMTPAQIKAALKAQKIIYEQGFVTGADNDVLLRVSRERNTPISVEEAAQATGIPVDQIQSAINSGKITMGLDEGVQARKDLGVFVPSPGGSSFSGSFFSFLGDVGGGVVDLNKDFLGSVGQAVDTVVDPIANTLGVHPDVVKVAAAALGMYYAAGVGFIDAAGATVSEAAAAEMIAASGAEALAAAGNMEAAAALAAGAESLAVPSMLPGATAFPVATAPLATMGASTPLTAAEIAGLGAESLAVPATNALAPAAATAAGANALAGADLAAISGAEGLAVPATLEGAGANALATGASAFDAASGLETQLGTITPGASAADLAWMDTVSPSQLAAIDTGALPGLSTLPFSLSGLAKFAKDYGVPLSALASAFIGSRAATDAAETQAQSAREARQLARDIFNEQKALQEPYRAAGITAQNRLLDLIGLSGNTAAAEYGKFARPFGMSDFQQDPGYAFRLSEGMKALEASRAARGGLLSGATGKALQRYGQEMGSQEYGNAFNRFQTERSNRLQPLSGLMTLGQAAASNQGAAAGAFGQTAGNLTTDIGAAQAAGGIGSANAITNALNQFARYSAGQNLANQIRSSVYAPAIG